MTTAREDDFTDEIPTEGDVLWGQGKIDCYDAILAALIASGVEDVTTEVSWNVFPNPTSDYLRIDGLNGEVSSVQVIDMLGSMRSVFSSIDQVYVSDLQAGTYFLRLVVDGRVEMGRFVVR